MEENLDQLIERVFYKVIDSRIENISCDFYYKINNIDVILSLIPRSEKAPEENRFSTVDSIVKNPVWYTGMYLSISSNALFDFNLRIGSISYTVPRLTLSDYAYCVDILNKKIKEYEFNNLHKILE